MKKTQIKELVLSAVSILICIFVLCSCTDEEHTVKTLKQAGFHDIKTQGFDMWACGKGDNYATKFVAKNAEGQTARGTVCCGWLKNCTIRFE